MWRIYSIVGAVLLAVGAVLGWYLHPIPAPVEKVEVREVVVEKVVTVTTKPDGTIIREEKNKTANNTSKGTTPVAQKKPRWAISSYMLPSLIPMTAPVWSGDVAYRLGDSSVWAVIGYTPTQKQVILGMRLEF